MARRERLAAKPVSELVGKVLEPVFARRAGMTMDIITAWDELVGDAFARTTFPEKINWPRRATSDDPFEPATLVIACHGANAILLQHETDQLKARINTFFGFDAIGRIRIVQKPVARVEPSNDDRRPEKPDELAQLRLKKILEGIDDDALKTRLAELGEGVLARKRQ